MMLLSDQGYYISEIAEIVRLDRHTVSRHVHAYEEEGLQALYDDEIPGRPPKLTEQQREQVAEWLEGTPRDLDYNQSKWTMKLLSYHIHKTFGVRLSENRVRIWAHRLGFNLVRPRQVSREADEEEKERAKGFLDELQELVQKGAIKLFYQDEAKLTRLPTKTQAWTKKGEQTQVPIEDDHDHRYVYGAFEPFSGQVHYRFHPQLEADGFSPFVDQLRRQYDYGGDDPSLVIVLDNARAHGYVGTHGLVEVEGEDGLFFYFLPPYSPDLNLAERIWKVLRKRVTHNYLFETWEELKEAARRHMQYLQVMDEKVVSLMGAV